MVSSRIAAATALAAIVLVAGCRTTGTPDFADGTQTIDRAELPAPARTALAALRARLTGGDAGGRDVRGLADAAPVVRQKYPGFHHAGTRVATYEADVGEGVAALGGNYIFADDLGRRVGVSFRLNYTAAPDGGVRVERFGVMPLFARQPRTESYVVRIAAIEDSLQAASADFARLYRLARTNAVDAGVDPERSEEYGVFVFYMDRLFPGGRIETRLHNKEDGKGPRDVVGKALRYDGGNWGAGLIAARFKLNPQAPYWVKALYAVDGRAELEVVGRHAVRPAAPGS